MVRAFRIRTLLLLGAALPLAVVVAFTVNLAVQRRGAMDEAGQVQRDVRGAVALLIADRSVVRELGASDNVAAAAEVGVDPFPAAQALGIDLEGELSRLRADTDAALADLSTMFAKLEFAAPDQVEGVIQSTPGFDTFRAEVDAGRVTTAQVDAMWSGISADLRSALDAQLDVLSRVGNVAGAERIRADVRATLVAAELGREIQDEIFAMAQVLVTDLVMIETDAMTELAITSAAVDDQIEHLEGELLPEHQADLDRIVTSEDFLAFVQIREAALAGGFADGGPELQQAGIVSINAGITIIDMVGGLAEELIADVGADAEYAESVAAAALKRSLSGVIAVAGLTLLTVMMATRAIVRPLGRLEHRARRISDGLLDHEERNPNLVREVRVVHEAMDHMVHNLRVLERQADALSVGDIESARLDDEPPGRLGASLRRSVERLTELTARLEHQARHDTLTGLPNRAATMAAMEGALARGQRQASDVALLFVDLDDFKWINDANGHAVGDAVLEETASRLRKCCRAGDTVGRLGGDEFVVVMEGLSELAPAVAGAERMIEALREPYQVGGRSLSCSASIGLAWSPRGTGRSAELLHNADLATLRAKSLGRGRVELFDECLRVAVDERKRLEREIADDLKRDRLELWYQPIVGLPDRSVWGFEALLRLRSESGHLHGPGQLIPIAESSDLILDIDRWVLGEAARALATWQDRTEMVDMKLAVNVSSRHILNGDLDGDIGSACHAAGADARLLNLELTETGLIPDLEGAAAATEALHERGIALTIDDFGTGHSSVARLRSLRVERLKIDRSFVTSLDDENRSVVSAFTTLGRALDLEVVAEGVETAAQCEIVTELGCTHGQGFLFGRAMPDHRLGEWLVSQDSASSRI